MKKKYYNKNLKEIFQNKGSFKGILVYGAGIFGQDLLSLIQEEGCLVPVYYCDQKADSLQSVEGIKVIHPSTLNTEWNEYVVIIPLNGWFQDKLNTLKNIGIERNRIFISYDIPTPAVPLPNQIIEPLVRIESYDEHVFGLGWNVGLSMLSDGKVYDGIDLEKIPPIVEMQKDEINKYYLNAPDDFEHMRKGDLDGSKISILLPVYNAESELACCIESVLGQTYKNWELIIIDDGSTDNSGAICEKFAQNDPRIVFIRQDNKELSTALNTAFDKSTGDYITILYNDDYFTSKILEVGMSVMSQLNVEQVRMGIKESISHDEPKSVDTITCGVYTREELSVGVCHFRLGLNYMPGSITKKSVINDVRMEYYPGGHGDDTYVNRILGKLSHIAFVPGEWYLMVAKPMSLGRKPRTTASYCIVEDLFQKHHYLKEVKNDFWELRQVFQVFYYFDFMKRLQSEKEDGFVSDRRVLRAFTYQMLRHYDDIMDFPRLSQENKNLITLAKDDMEGFLDLFEQAYIDNKRKRIEWNEKKSRV